MKTLLSLLVTLLLLAIVDACERWAIAGYCRLLMNWPESLGEVTAKVVCSKRPSACFVASLIHGRFRINPKFNAVEFGGGLVQAVQVGAPSR